MHVLRKSYGYPAAFGIPTAAMMFAMAIFWSGRSKYIRKPPAGFMLGRVLGVIRCALMHKRAHAVVQPQPPQDSSERHSRHWVDGAVHCCPASLVADVRAVMRLLPLFACLPFFWALFDQQVCAF